jgi:hypothetical protein
MNDTSSANRFRGVPREDLGQCDYCETRYLVFDRSDHCAECGNCWQHCHCQPKRTIEDEAYAWDRLVPPGRRLSYSSSVAATCSRSSPSTRRAWAALTEGYCFTKSSIV